MVLRGGGDGDEKNRTGQDEGKRERGKEVTGI